jgi:hypothetical protein
VKLAVQLVALTCPSSQPPEHHDLSNSYLHHHVMLVFFVNLVLLPLQTSELDYVTLQVHWMVSWLILFVSLPYSLPESSELRPEKLAPFLGLSMPLVVQAQVSTLPGLPLLLLQPPSYHLHHQLPSCQLRHQLLCCPKPLSIDAMITSSHNSTIGTILLSWCPALHGTFSTPTHQVSSHWGFVKALWAHNLRFPQNATLDRPGEIQQLTSPPRLPCFSTNQTKGFTSSTCGPSVTARCCTFVRLLM